VGESGVDMKRGHAAVVAVAIGALTLALPADARPNKQKRSKVQKQYELQTQRPSLDGRTLGPGCAPADLIIFNTTGWGPYGPYCH
jgi:hypothetical protein